MNRFTLLIFSFIAILWMGCNSDNGSSSNDNNPDIPLTPAISFNIVASHPHDTSFFTQGLEFYKGSLFESTGQYGQSRLVQTEPATGKVIREVKLDNRYFGEGLTILGDSIFQLTWQENVVLVYEATSLNRIAEFQIRGQGWGITNNGSQLIVSNGSSDLFFYEPSSFRLLNTLTVRDNGSFVPNLNELEYVNGFVYANQWQSHYIFKIDPQSGNTVARMDLSDIVRQEKAMNPRAEFLNGIAYNPDTRRFHITGKNWSRIYELQVNE